MKRLFTLVALLSLVMGALVTGCSQSDNNPPPPPKAPDTNAPAPAK